MDMDNSVLIEEDGVGEEEGIKGINGDGKNKIKINKQTMIHLNRNTRQLLKGMM